MQQNNQELKYSYQFPAHYIALDNVIFGFDSNKCELQVLLIKRGIEPYKDQWALPGGFLRPNETLEDGALRELAEETKLKLHVGLMKQFGCYSKLDRDPRSRVISVAFVCLVGTQDVEGCDDAAEAKWVPLNSLIKLEKPNAYNGVLLPLAFDHKQLIMDALDYLRKIIHFEPIGFELLPEKFTMKALQELYELLLGVEFDRRNFHSKMKKIGILDEQPTSRPNAPRREARYYKFNTAKYQEFKQNGFNFEFEGTLISKKGKE